MKIPEITSAKRYHAFAQLITEAAVAGSQEELYAVVSKVRPQNSRCIEGKYCGCRVRPRV